MARALLLLVAALVTGLLSACAAVDSSVAPRYDTVSRNFAVARDEAILLNILRAAHHDPLSFSTISQAIPQLTNGTTVGLPVFFAGTPFCPTPATCAFPQGASGRGAIISDKVASNSTSIQTQFTLSTNETHSFYEALLLPVDLHVVDFFIRQGYSRELLFWLFADRVEVRIGSLRLGIQYDPRYRYGCPLMPNLPQWERRCFRDWAEIATITGLTVEEQTLKDNKSDGKSDGKSGGKGTRIAARVCFDAILAEQGQRLMSQRDPALLARLRRDYLDEGRAFKSLSPQCGAPWNPKLSAEDTLSFAVSSLTFRIVPRSAYGIYQFLGELLRERMKGKPVVPPDGYLEEQVLPYLATTEDKQILDVVSDGGPGCFIWTHFYDGDYCVPREASNTKQVIGLLAALTALQTTATDLAITPVVHTAD